MNEIKPWNLRVVRWGGIYYVGLHRQWEYSTHRDDRDLIHTHTMTITKAGVVGSRDCPTSRSSLSWDVGRSLNHTVSVSAPFYGWFVCTSSQTW